MSSSALRSNGSSSGTPRKERSAMDTKGPSSVSTSNATATTKRGSEGHFTPYRTTATDHTATTGMAENKTNNNSNTTAKRGTPRKQQQSGNSSNTILRKTNSAAPTSSDNPPAIPSTTNINKGEGGDVVVRGSTQKQTKTKSAASTSKNNLTTRTHEKTNQQTVSSAPTNRNVPSSSSLATNNKGEPIVYRPVSPDSKAMSVAVAAEEQEGGNNLSGVGRQDNDGENNGDGHVQNNSDDTSKTPFIVEAFQAFTHRRVEPTAGQRMGRIRQSKSLAAAAVVAACRLGVNSQLEAIEGGASAIERWAAVLGRFAINLEVPVDYLFPTIIIPQTVAAGTKEKQQQQTPSPSPSPPPAAIPELRYDDDEDEDAVGYYGGNLLPFSSHGDNANSNNKSTTGATIAGGVGGACGLRLRSVRAERGQSVETVIQRTGVKPQEYAQIERGESLGGYEKWVWIIARFCRFANVNPFLIVGGLQIEDDEDDEDGDEAGYGSNSSSRLGSTSSSVVIDLDINDMYRMGGGPASGNNEFGAARSYF